MSGTIPSEYGRLQNLEFFQIYATDVSGTIPSNLGLLIKMRNLCAPAHHTHDRDEVLARGWMWALGVRV